MPNEHNRSIFIFRRDLRLEDNTGLNMALKDSGEVVPIFVLDVRQAIDNDYKSENALQFMQKSLRELNSALEAKGSQLHLYLGKAEEVVAKLLESSKFEAVYVNRDYTPFSIKRDEAISLACHLHNAKFVSCADALLCEPESVRTKAGKPYSVFTPFYNTAREHPVQKPSALHSGKLISATFLEGNLHLDDFSWSRPNPNIALRGGRAEAIKLLGELGEKSRYSHERDIPSLNSTSHLSAHLKFGTCSIREAYWAARDSLGAGTQLLREFYWRDFFTHVAFNFPHVFSSPFNKAYSGIKWENDKTKFRAWCEGKTGFPIIDAGMRELNQSGFMHNRVRMIVSSFLTKDLKVDWRLGEKYFAQKLVDYDPCVNNGNWQWAAGSGCDAQPYFRIFNPWLQQKKFDPKCEYIQKWVGELNGISAKSIHGLERQHIPGISYPRPIVEHASASKSSVLLYSRALKLSGKAK